MWIAPGTADVSALLPDGQLRDHVHVFHAEPAEPAAVGQMVRDAYDLPAIAGRYQEFLRRWDTPRPLPAVPDDLARQLWLVSEWLLILRDDPRIPLRHLPPNWSAVAAEEVFQRRHDRLNPRAQKILDQVVDTVEIQPP
jgi:phenylacetic acid degradation operon negative regulatory protein